MTLPEMSVRNPVTTVMIFMVVLVIGAVCYFQMPLDLFPKMEIPSITVVTLYAGAAPEDVESKVTDMLERHLSTVSDLKHIGSVSKEGASVITLGFEWGSDLDTRANEVRDAIGMAKLFLPEDVDEPRVFKIDLSKFPIMVYGVSAQESYANLEKILEDEVARPLKRLPGVASVQTRVPLHRQVNVYVDRERLAACNLTLQEVVWAINRDNRDVPAGSVEDGLTDYLVRVPGEYKNAAAMQRMVVAMRAGGTVMLGDIAEVQDGFQEEGRYITINGGHGALLMVQKESGANSVEVARRVKARMKDLLGRLPPDVRIVNVMDSSQDIERLIHDLTRNLWMGGLLAMAVVLVFLRKWRATLIIGLTIPFSLILSLVAGYFLGYTLNMMTLFGMIIAIGMVVDNAIVVLENISRHREEGERYDEGSIYGAGEVAMAISASTLTTVCIFFPIVFVQGIMKIFFREFAIIVSVTLLASLFSALTLAPMLSSVLLRKMAPGAVGKRFFEASERAFDRLSEGYGRLLAWALDHRLFVVLFALALFGSTLVFMPFLGSEFMPEEDRGMLQGTINMPIGTRVAETAAALAEIDDILKEEVPEEERVAVYTACGKSEASVESMMQEQGTHVGVFGVKLTPLSKRSRRASDIAAVLRRRIEEKRGVLNIDKFVIDAADPMQGLVMGDEKPMTVNIIGNDMDATDELARKIMEIVKKVPGAVDAGVTRKHGRPELWLDVDRQKAFSLGLNASAVGDTIRAAFQGTTASKFRVGGDEYDIVVRLREADRSRVSDIELVPIRLPVGGQIRAGSAGKTSYRNGPVEIRRKDRGRIVSVTANIFKRSLGEVVADVEKGIRKLDVPPGVEIVMGGQTEDQRESFFWLQIALLIGIILVYMVMASQFESFIDPFVVMLSVPFAFTGAIWALVLGGHNISVVVFIGMLLLVGVVVNNAIVLVDYINILRARGIDTNEAVRRAGRTRLRPVLMTALTTIVALIPMAFAKGQGSEVWNPLGATVLGGLMVSTAVTLVLVPTLYSVAERVKTYAAVKLEGNPE